VHICVTTEAESDQWDLSAAASQTSTAHRINTADECDAAGNHDDVGQRHPARALEQDGRIDNGNGQYGAVADAAQSVLCGGFGCRTSLRRQLVGVDVSTVRLGPAAGRRGCLHRLSDPESNGLLLFLSGKRQHTRRARARDALSDGHHLQRERFYVVRSSVSWYDNLCTVIKERCRFSFCDNFGTRWPILTMLLLLSLRMG